MSQLSLSLLEKKVTIYTEKKNFLCRQAKPKVFGYISNGVAEGVK